MNKRHLVVAVVAALALSSSTIASAEDGSHRRMDQFEDFGSIPAIALSNIGGTLTIDTSTATPSLTFDTSTVTPHIDFDTATATTHFDTATATSSSDDEPMFSNDGMSQDDFLPAGASAFSPTPPNPAIPPAGLTTPPAGSEDPNESAPPFVAADPATPPAGLTTPVPPADPNVPVTPPVPSWITKPHGKSNDDNQDQPNQNSPQDSQD